MSKLDYLAGIIDGEGCLSITEQHGVYSGKIWVVNTDKVLIKWLISNFGGKMSVSRHAKGNRRTCYRWSIERQNEVSSLLKKVKPRLVIKKEQADCVLKFRALIKIHKIRSGNRSLKQKKEAKRIKCKIKILKEKCSKLKHKAEISP